MAYIGNTNTTQAFIPAVDYFNGDGATVAFTLSRPVASVAQVEAVIENVPQNPSSAYTVSGQTITFTSAPPLGISNIYVGYTSPITQVIQPGQGTVSPSSLSTGGMYWDASGNVGIGTANPSYKLDVAGTGNFTGKLGVAADSAGAGVTNGINLNSAGNGFIRGTTTDGIGTGVRGTNVQILSWQGIGFGSSISGQPVGEGENAVVINGRTGEMYIRGQKYSAVTGVSGATTTYAEYGCRAWVNFNGTGTVAIRASGNVTSITDNGTGNYTVNFTTAMPDNNYTTVVTPRRTDGGGGASGDPNAHGCVAGSSTLTYNSAVTTTSVRVITATISALGVYDMDCFVAVFR